MPINTKECDAYAAIVSVLPDIVFVVTESGRYADTLGGYDSQFYHDASPLIGKSLYDVFPKEKAEWFLTRVKETLRANRLMIFEYELNVGELENIDSDSGPSGSLWFEGRVNPLKSLHYGERAVVWVARNITERHRLLTELQSLSEVDSLSGIFNRRKLFEHLHKAFYGFQRYKENYCFLLLDIDDFKLINDTWGHQAGDDVIRYIGNVCQSELRHTDIVGRLGGDEFGIIHKNTSEVSYMALARRLLEILNGHSGASARTFNFDVSVSIGISRFHENDDSAELAYHRADLALYQSKRNGKNKFSVVETDTNQIDFL